MKHILGQMKHAVHCGVVCRVSPRGPTLCLQMEPHIKARRHNSMFIAGIKPGAVTSGVTGPTSQIPGLSQSADESSPVERTSGRRVGIFESDSDYIKLAKGGGHKGKH